MMTKIQGWLVIGLLAFLCLHLLAGDVVAIKMISNLSDSGISEVIDQPSDTQTDFPDCDEEWCQP